MAPAPVLYPLKGKRVWIAGHAGMVGSALVRRLADEQCELLTVGRAELDLRRQAGVDAWLDRTRPHAVFLAAATVGGILANATYPATFLYDNLMIEANVIEAARRSGVEKLLFLGSACIYPREAPQPIPESALLTGPLEPTNAAYALAKIAGIRLCQAYRTQHGCDFIAAQPNNLYGPNDNFDLASSHVLPALIAKAHAAKQAGAASFEVWGSGRPLREFLYVDDLADALVFLMERYSGAEHVNVGSGEEISVHDLAFAVARVVGFEGKVTFDAGRPDGMPRKLIDPARLEALGWRARTSLAEGLERTYAWFLEHVAR